jgi:hypothetical protein
MAEPTVQLPLRLALQMADQIAFTATRSGRTATRVRLTALAGELSTAISEQSLPEELAVARVAVMLEAKA